jgi:hypothetical protein
MPRTPRSSDGANGPAKATRRSTKKPNSNGAIPDDLVAKRAYEIYESRGGEHGRDFEDWLEAERQLRQGYRAAPVQTERRKRTRAESGS